MILDKQSETPLYMQIYAQTKQQIETGMIPAGQKIESIRSFAAKHGLSTTTVEKAYTQLLVEGYVKSVPKSGYYAETVEAIANAGTKHAILPHRKREMRNLGQHPGTFDHRFKKHVVRILSKQPNELMLPSEPQGEWALRYEIARFLTRERGVATVPERIIIAAGVQNHLMTLGGLLKKQTVAFLKPLFDRAKHIFDLLGYTLIPCETLDEICAAAPSLIYISPSNLYPSGDIVGIGERQKLIRYADRNNALIIEDDYNHMFRYNAYQIPSIQGLAGGEHVVYIGSFSRHFLISMRIGYMVLPPVLMKRYIDMKPLAQTVSKLDQLATGHYMKSGDFARQLKRIATVSRRQNDALRAVLDTLPSRDDIELGGIQSNLHLLVRCKHDEMLNILKRKATSLNLFVNVFDDLENTLLIPYAGLTEDALKTVFTSLLAQ